MKNYRQLLESLPKSTVVFTYGRYSPPTIGHELLFKVIKKIAVSNKADHVIYVSRTQDKKKNPLPIDRKMHYLNIMFPGFHFVAASDEARTFIEAAKLLNKKYKNLIMVAGSDRVEDFTRLLNNYNGKEYNFDSIQVISAGERDPDSDEASGMSATKMRAAAVKGDYPEFKKGLSSTVRNIDGKMLMNEIRTGLGHAPIKEQLNLVKDSIREQYFRGEIFNLGDIVESNSIQYEIVKRGSNHLLLKEQSGALVSKWIQDVTLVENYTTITHNKDHKELNHGSDFSMKIGKADFNKIISLNHNDKHEFNCMDGNGWGVLRKDNKLHFTNSDNNGITSNISFNVSHNSFMNKEEPEVEDELQIKSYSKVLLDKAKNEPEKLTGQEKTILNMIALSGGDKKEINDKITPKQEESKMNEELTTKTIKPADKLKVARIIASFLSIDNPEALSSPEQIVNMGLRKVRNKALNAESIAILHKMLALADEVGIQYDVKLKPGKLKESIDSRVTVDPKSGYNAAKDVMRYTDFKKLMKMNKGEIPEEVDVTLPPNNRSSNPNLYPRYKKEKITAPDNASSNPTDYEDKVAGAPDEYKPDTGEAPPAASIALKDLENQGPVSSEVGSSYGHGNDSQLRRRKVHYQREEVEIDEDVYTSEYKLKQYVDPATGETKTRKIRPHRIDFAASKANSAPAQKDKGDDVREDKKAKKPYPVKRDEIGGGAQNQGFDAFFKEENEEHEEEITDHELDKMVDSIKDIEDIIDAYDDAELAIIDDEGHEIEKDLKEEALNEVLSRMERVRAKVRFAQTKSKRENKAKIALKRHSDTATINKRARHLAIILLKKRFTKKADLSKLSIGEKERVEAFISKKKKLINRLAMKLTSRVRKIENTRLAHHNYTKN